MNQVLSRVRPVRTYLLMTYDFAAWVASFAAMATLQFLVGYSSRSDIIPAAALGVGCGVAFVALGFPVHLHRGRSPVGSFPDAVLTTLIGGSVALLGLAVNLALGAPVRVSVTVTAPMCAFVLIMGARASYRMLREWSDARGRGERASREPVVVIGAGDGGIQLVTAMLRDTSCPWRPVALVDDDPLKRHRRISGVPVVGESRAVRRGGGDVRRTHRDPGGPERVRPNSSASSTGWPTVAGWT